MDALISKLANVRAIAAERLPAVDLATIDEALAVIATLSSEAARWRWWLHRRSVTLDVALHGNGCTTHTAAQIEAATDALMAR